MREQKRAIAVGLNGNEGTITRLAELQSLLRQARDNEYNEMWMQHHNKTILSFLSSKGRALMIFSRYDGDPGLTSRDTWHKDEADITIPFRLSNGQVDAFPIGWTVSFNQAQEGMEEYFETKVVPSHIQWYDENKRTSRNSDDASEETRYIE